MTLQRERLTQIVLVIVGMLNLALIYFLYMDLRHSSWLLERNNECGPMFLSARHPTAIKGRSMLATDRSVRPAGARHLKW